MSPMCLKKRYIYIYLESIIPICFKSKRTMLMYWILVQPICLKSHEVYKVGIQFFCESTHPSSCSLKNQIGQCDSGAPLHKHQRHHTTTSHKSKQNKFAWRRGHTSDNRALLRWVLVGVTDVVSWSCKTNWFSVPFRLWVIRAHANTLLLLEQAVEKISWWLILSVMICFLLLNLIRNKNSIHQIPSYMLCTCIHFTFNVMRNNLSHQVKNWWP